MSELSPRTGGLFAELLSRRERNGTDSQLKLKKAKLRENIEKVKNEFDAAFNNFDNVGDPELTEQIIYHLKSVEAHYGKLLREAKELNAG